MKLTCEICGLAQMPKGPLGQMIRITHKFADKRRVDALYAHKFCLDRAKLQVDNEFSSFKGANDIETNS